MTYGFELRNSSNKLVANSTDFNYGLIASGTITASTASWTAITIPSVGDTSETPLVFFKFNNITTNSATYFPAVRTLSNISLDVGFFNLPYPTAGDSYLVTGSVEYRMYRTFKGLPNVSGETYGIQLYDASLNKTFDSNYQIPKITGLVNLGPILPISTNFNSLPSVAIPSGYGTSIWLSINSSYGMRGFWPESGSVYFCWPGMYCVNNFIVGAFGTSIGGGPGASISNDSTKTIMLMAA